MEKNEIGKLEAQIKGLGEMLKRLGDDKDLHELLMLIRKPGFTTPAEAFLLGSAFESMDGMAKNLITLKHAVLEGSRKVGVQ